MAGASSGFPPIPKGPITLGISAPTSGALASYGILTKIQTGVALQQFNMMHPNGIDGHQVKLDIENDASDVTSAVQVANQMVTNKDAAVITASYNPAAAGQQLAVWTKAKMPVVANLELTNTLTPAQLAKQYPYLFSPNPSLQQTGVAAIAWIKKKGFKNVGILNDGIPYDTVFANQIGAGVKKAIKNAKVTTVNITPNSVDNSAAITKLKGSGAQLLVVTAGEGYGPIWQAILSANWSPTILASAGAWYSGFDSMGTLTSKASAYYYNCADTAAQTFTPVQNQLMAAYAKGTNYQLPDLAGHRQHSARTVELRHHQVPLDLTGCHQEGDRGHLQQAVPRPVLQVLADQSLRAGRHLRTGCVQHGPALRRRRRPGAGQEQLRTTPAWPVSVGLGHQAGERGMTGEREDVAATGPGQ